MAAARREGVSIQCVLCLRRFRGFAPKNPTTFEKVDETFVFLHFLKYSLWALPMKRPFPFAKKPNKRKRVKSMSNKNQNQNKQGQNNKNQQNQNSQNRTQNQNQNQSQNKRQDDCE